MGVSPSWIWAEVERSEKYQSGLRMLSPATERVTGDHVFLLERILLGRPVSQDPPSAPRVLCWVTSNESPRSLIPDE